MPSTRSNAGISRKDSKPGTYGIVVRDCATLRIDEIERLGIDQHRDRARARAVVLGRRDEAATARKGAVNPSRNSTRRAIRSCMRARLRDAAVPGRD